MGRAPKLTDVAKAAGVSLGTASNAFNRPELVREEVREQVLAAARTLGYGGPDPAARLLMGGKANAIGVLPVGDMAVSFAISSPYLRALLLGIAEVCDEHSASLMVVPGTRERKQWTIRNALVDGFVLGNPDEVEMMRARQRQVPFVMVDTDAGPEVNSVRIDGHAGARFQAEHLLELGHRRFAILAVQRRPVDPVWHPPSRRSRKLRNSFQLDEEKLRGYAEALAEAGLSIDEVPIVEAYPPWAEAGAKLLLDKAPEATAILAMSDRNAIVVMEEAARRGLRIPEDLSLIGFDDVGDAETTMPPLTTVAQDIVEKGRIAARMLFAEGPPQQRVLPVHLVVRGTTAPPRAEQAARRQARSQPARIKR